MIREKYELSLEEAKKTLQTAERMTFSTYFFIKENRLLIKIFEELYGAVLNLVKAILQYEYLYKRIRLYADATSNFETFKECASRYKIGHEQIKDVKRIFALTEKHKKSPVEFVRKDSYVILSDNLHTDFITLDVLKHYLGVTRDIMHKAEEVFEKKF